MLGEFSEIAARIFLVLVKPNGEKQMGGRVFIRPASAASGFNSIYCSKLEQAIMSLSRSLSHTKIHTPVNPRLPEMHTLVLRTAELPSGGKTPAA